MVRVNQYSQAVRYSSYQRNRNYVPDGFRRPRASKTSWKSSWNPVVTNRRRGFRTRHLNEVLPLSLSTGTKFIQLGYVTLPPLGKSHGCRKKKFMLLKGVEVQGTFRIMSLAVESKPGVSMEIERPPALLAAAASPGPGVNGMVTFFVVLDKRPRGDALANFDEIFEFKKAGYRGDAVLKNFALDRFALLIKKRNVFQSQESTRIIPFRCSYVPKERLWVEFHDYDVARCGGNFKNIAANGLLYYVVYESHGNSVCWPSANSCITY